MRALYVIVFVLNWSWSSGYIKSAPPRVSPSKAQKVNIFVAGSIAKLQCPVNADPSHLIIEWVKNEVPVDQTGRFRVALNGVLRIETVQVQDSGIYTCKAVNGFGSTYANVTVTVLRKEEYNQLNLPSDDNRSLIVPNYMDYKPMLPPNVIKPYFNKEPANKFIRRELGDTLKLRCNAGGKPKPYISWLKNGLSLDQVSLPEGSQTEGPILIIPNVRLHDSGDYKCLAQNGFGEISTKFIVTIIDTKPYLPEITQVSPVNATIVIGEPVVLECHYKSKSESMVQWFKSYSQEDSLDLKDESRAPLEIQGELFSSVKSSRVNDLVNGTYINRLILNSTKLSDSGRYICSVVNLKGFTYNYTYLQVVPFCEKDSYHDEILFKASYSFLCIMILLIIFITLLIIFTIVIFVV